MTLQKHQNTIICSQIFRKHAKFTYLFLQKILQTVILLWNVRSVSEYLFDLVCVTPPTANLPNSISTPRDASWWNTQHIRAMEASKRTESEITDSTQYNIRIHLKISMTRGILKCGMRLFMLCVFNLATRMSVECFEFRLQLLFHLLAVNITYCITFTFSHFADAFIQSDVQLGNT